MPFLRGASDIMPGVNGAGPLRRKRGGKAENAQIALASPHLDDADKTYPSKMQRQTTGLYLQSVTHVAK